jgi:hypothetical protein
MRISLSMSEQVRFRMPGWAGSRPGVADSTERSWQAIPAAYPALLSMAAGAMTQPNMSDGCRSMRSFLPPDGPAQPGEVADNQGRFPCFLRASRHRWRAPAIVEGGENPSPERLRHLAAWVQLLQARHAEQPLPAVLTLSDIVLARQPAPRAITRFSPKQRARGTPCRSSLRKRRGSTGAVIDRVFARNGLHSAGSLVRPCHEKLRVPSTRRLDGL